MSGRKKVKKKVLKKRIEPKIANRSDAEHLVIGSQLIAQDLQIKFDEAVECLKRYTKKDQIGELANQAIELLNKWGIPLDVSGS